MDNRLKGLMKELGEAINSSLSDSDEIAEVISRIKAGGYDVFLVLEATIGLNQRDGDAVERRPIRDPADRGRLPDHLAGREVPEVAAHPGGRW